MALDMGMKSSPGMAATSQPASAPMGTGKMDTGMDDPASTGMPITCPLCHGSGQFVLPPADGSMPGDAGATAMPSPATPSAGSTPMPEDDSAMDGQPEPDADDGMGEQGASPEDMAAVSKYDKGGPRKMDKSKAGSLMSAFRKSDEKDKVAKDKAMAKK